MLLIGNILLTIGTALIIIAFRIHKKIHAKSEFLACLTSGLLLFIGFMIAVIGASAIGYG